MKTRTIGILILAGAGLLYYMDQQQSSGSVPPWYNPNNVPPQPQQPTPTPAWQQWAMLIISVYGAVDWLWQPGGPFYKVPTNAVYDALPDPGQYNWNDPNSLPGGIV